MSVNVLQDAEYVCLRPRAVSTFLYEVSAYFDDTFVLDPDIQADILSSVLRARKRSRISKHLIHHVPGIGGDGRNFYCSSSYDVNKGGWQNFYSGSGMPLPKSVTTAFYNPDTGIQYHKSSIMADKFIHQTSKQDRPHYSGVKKSRSKPLAPARPHTPSASEHLPLSPKYVWKLRGKPIKNPLDWSDELVEVLFESVKRERERDEAWKAANTTKSATVRPKANPSNSKLDQVSTNTSWDSSVSIERIAIKDASCDDSETKATDTIMVAAEATEKHTTVPVAKLSQGHDSTYGTQPAQETQSYTHSPKRNNNNETVVTPLIHNKAYTKTLRPPTSSQLRRSSRISKLREEATRANAPSLLGKRGRSSDVAAQAPKRVKN